MDTPIFGPFDVSRSPNASDNQLINLYPELVETKQGKEVGALYLCPGLDLLATVGVGPIRGEHAMGDNLFIVSGGSFYQLDTGYNVISTFPGMAAGQVTIIDNGTQVAIFCGNKGVIAPAGHPLTGGTVGVPGAEYNVSDTITLRASSGQQIATAVLGVTAVDGSGGVTAFSVESTGSFIVEPTGFTQAETDGSGAGFTLISPTYGPLALFNIPLPFGTTDTPISAAYQDGFGVITQPGTGLWFQSVLLDLSVWNALNFGDASGDPDDVVAIAQIHREMWLVKQYETEIWYNAGTPGFTFARLDGAYIEVGIVAPASLVRLGESLVWLGRTKEGQGIVYQTKGHAAGRISTHAVEDAIAKYTTISDAIAYSYQQDGHQFYVLSFPTGNATWVFDATTSAEAGVPMWHRRGAFLNGQLNRHWSNCGVFFNGKTIVGDYRNGNLYAYNLDTLTDNGTARKVLRSWRALAKPAEQPIRFNDLRIDMMTGIGIGPQDDPLFVLRWSDDGGHTWSDEHFAHIGKTGETAKRVIFRRLGSTRRSSGLDRIFELSSTDKFPAAIIGALLT